MVVHGIYEFAHGGFGFAAHYYHMVVGKALLGEISGTGAQQHHIGMRSHLVDNMHSLEVALNREIYCPDEINVGIALGDELSQRCFVAVAVEHKVAPSDIVHTFLLEHGSYGEFVDIRHGIHHASASGGALGRLMPYEFGRCEKSNLHFKQKIALFL